jgi:hypothetical protein
MLFTTVRFTTPEETEKFTRQAIAEALAALPSPAAIGQTKGGKKAKKRRGATPPPPATLHFIPKSAVSRKRPKGQR